MGRTLFGIATSGVVLSTTLAAADADYRLFIVKDCCADLDETIHACLMEKIFPRSPTARWRGITNRLTLKPRNNPVPTWNTLGRQNWMG
jgi:nicotinamidase-related amidase